MRKIMRTVVIGATLLLSPCVMAGSDGVEHAMKMMNKSYRAALKEEDGYILQERYAGTESNSRVHPEQPCRRV